MNDETAVYGSDAAEVFRGRDAIAKMLANDAKLWGGTARVGEMRDISVVTGGEVQSIFFQAPFTVRGQRPLMVRYCMVWRRSGGKWLLLQSSNSVLTEDQSAEQLMQ